MPLRSPGSAPSRRVAAVWSDQPGCLARRYSAARSWTTRNRRAAPPPATQPPLRQPRSSSNANLPSWSPSRLHARRRNHRSLAISRSQRTVRNKLQDDRAPGPKPAVAAAACSRRSPRTNRPRRVRLPAGTAQMGTDSSRPHPGPCLPRGEPSRLRRSGPQSSARPSGPGASTESTASTTPPHRNDPRAVPSHDRVGDQRWPRPRLAECSRGHERSSPRPTGRDEWKGDVGLGWVGRTQGGPTIGIAAKLSGQGRAALDASKLGHRIRR